MDEFDSIITAEESGERIDALLARNLPGLSRSQVQKLLEQGQVSLDSRPVKKNYRCTAGDSFLVILPQLQDVPLVPQNRYAWLVPEDAI